MLVRLMTEFHLNKASSVNILKEVEVHYNIVKAQKQALESMMLIRDHNLS